MGYAEDRWNAFNASRGNDPDFTIDWDAILDHILTAASIALRADLLTLRSHAQYHAPVRKLFSTRGAPRRPNSWTLRRGGRRAYEGRGPSNFGPRLYASFLAQRPRQRQFKIKSAASFLEIHGGNRGFYGHPNSLIPVFRVRDEDTHKVKLTQAGDFRRINPSSYSITRSLDPYPHFMEREQATGRVRNYNEPGESPMRLINPATQQLTARGRWEIKNGRAKQEALRDSSLDEPEGTPGAFQQYLEGTGIFRIGGRLRETIYVKFPRMEGDVLVGYVVSPVPYALFQEFGTRHNRAQPYMRPALYEVQSSFRAHVAAAITRDWR
jgi:hypothetical protein